MPLRKSAPSLETLCFQAIAKNYDEIHFSLSSLPHRLINKLYQRRNELKLDDCRLHSDIFIHSRTRELDLMSIFDLDVNRLLPRIGSVCKNLSMLIIANHGTIQPRCVIDLLKHLPHIQHLNLAKNKWCTDEILIAIGTHCPELKHLDLKGCREVTDSGVHSLSNMKIEYLDINGTEVTVDGCSFVLTKLSFLKVLKYDRWFTLLQHLKRDFYADSTTYTLEEAPWVGLEEDDLTTVPKMFPNSRSFYVGKFLNQPPLFFSPHIALELSNPAMKRLTKLILSEIELVNIRLIGLYCPLLQCLEMDECSFDHESDAQNPINHVGFRNLRRLFARNIHGDEFIPELHLLMLLSGGKIEDIHLCNCPALTDGLITRLLKVNALQNLSCLKLMLYSLSASSIMKLMEVKNPLKTITLSANERKIIEPYVVSQNLDIEWSGVETFFL